MLTWAQAWSEKLRGKRIRDAYATGATVHCSRYLKRESRNIWLLLTVTSNKIFSVLNCGDEVHDIIH